MRRGTQVTSSRIEWAELVVPPAWNAHACDCDVMGEAAEPGIPVCWRLHKNIRQRWAFCPGQNSLLQSTDGPLPGHYYRFSIYPCVGAWAQHGNLSVEDYRAPPKEGVTTTVTMLFSLSVPELFLPCCQIISAHRDRGSDGNVCRPGLFIWLWVVYRCWR